MIRRLDVIEAAWELLIERYQKGESLDVLAQQHSATRHWLTVQLKRRGAFIDGRKNKPQKDQCVNGDDLAMYGVQMYKDLPNGRRVKNGRVCSGPKCLERKRERQRVERRTDQQQS